MIYDAFDNQVQRSPNKVALKCGDVSLTYLGLSKVVKSTEAEILAKSPSFVKLLKGDLQNSITSAAVLLAAAKVGATILCGEFSQEVCGSVLKLLHTQDSEHRPFLLLRTSGTTSEPKLIALSEEVKYLRASQCENLYDVCCDDTVLAGTPLHHSLAQRLLFTGLLNGATVNLLPAYSPDRWLEAMRGTTFTMSVPEQLRHLSDERQIPIMRCLVSSSDTLPTAVADRLKTFDRPDCYECYGASEVAVVASGAIGEGMELSEWVKVKIVEGEIYVRSRIVQFTEYYGNVEATNAAMDGEWFKTGDSGTFEDGILTMTGRSADIIKVGGVRVSPEALDALLMEQGVTAATFGVPDPQGVLGEVVAVAVTSDITLRRIQHMLLSKVDDAAIPRMIVLVPELPRTLTGKLMRRRLKEYV